MSNDTICSYHDSIPNGHARQQDSARADPDIAADGHRREVVNMAFVRPQTVINGRHGDAMPDQRAVTYGDAALILKAAAGIDEHAPAEADILAEVRVKRRKKTKILRHVPPGDAAHKVADFFRRVGGAVEFHSQALRLVTEGMHAVKGFRADDQRISGVHIRQQFFKIHDDSDIFRAGCPRFPRATQKLPEKPCHV